MTAAMPNDVRAMNAAASVLVGLAALVLCVLAWTWVKQLPAFSLRAIRIDGEVLRSNVPTIRANALPRLQGTLFTVDLRQAQRAFESVPWVRRAVVRRQWPDTLLVTLEEHRPVAYWGEERDARLVNSHGEIFDANLGDVEDDALPRLLGPQGQGPLMLGMHGRLSSLFRLLPARLEALQLSERGGWLARLDSGARIELGRGEPAEVLERATRFVQTLAQVTAAFERPLEYADLRHRDGYAVRLRGITTLEPGEAAPPATPRR